MPVLQLAVGSHGPNISVHDVLGGIVNVPRPQFRCLLEVPGFLLPRDAIIDTGSPLTIFPHAIWGRFRLGTDYEFLPFVTGTPSAGRVLGWHFTFLVARFLIPLAVMDTGLTTQVVRPRVVAAFALGDPPSPTGRNALPPVIVGLWGGVLEGGRIATDHDPSTGGVRGELHYP